MGMVGCFAALPAAQLAQLQSGERSIEDFLYPDDGDGEPEHSIDVDKAWHGLHYLLTGTAWGGDAPLCLAVLGGEEFGPDVGYGPARALTATQVASVAAALAGLPADKLASRYQPADMAKLEIYPDVIWVRDGAEALDYLLENYQQLVEFYRDAAARGDAVIQWLS
ncbi:YfbM family protein [Inhella proteolytica]|uniref:YfbM family protein n=1 Tax=Inhella proteolytica TaxID=2795029 RepID=A0A931JAC6_9BURK|nr:YfbM family protein [Inhella proteolytica]MBH9579322.1 YfbM family protein [Inhella proteolytica]